jgi:hypothetical protein
MQEIETKISDSHEFAYSLQLIVPHLISSNQSFSSGIPFQHSDFRVVLGIAGKRGHRSGFTIHHPTRHHSWKTQEANVSQKTENTL